MKINDVVTTYVTPKTTGYTALGGLGLTVASGYSKNKNFRNMHKPLAIFTGLTTLLHVGQIEYNHYKWKHKK